LRAKVKLILTSISLAGVLIVSFQNCGSGWVNKVKNEGNFSLKSELPISIDSSSGPAAFKSGFYTWAQQKSCTTCHGSVIKPYFASPDSDLAYNEAKSSGIIDLANPLGSKVIAHSGNGHCNLGICTSEKNPIEVAPLIEAWAKAETGGGSPTTIPMTALPKYMTATVPMPATIPTTMVANPAILRLQLSGFGVPALTNAILELEIQMISLEVYRISRPKIGGNSAQVIVKNLHVFIKGPNDGGVGTEDLQGDFWLDSFTAPVFQLPNNLPNNRIGAQNLTGLAVTMPKKAVAPAVDMITIGIEDIQ
jgi:hypothetical protein